LKLFTLVFLGEQSVCLASKIKYFDLAAFCRCGKTLHCEQVCNFWRLREDAERKNAAETRKSVHNEKKRWRVAFSRWASSRIVFPASLWKQFSKNAAFYRSLWKQGNAERWWHWPIEMLGEMKCLILIFAH